MNKLHTPDQFKSTPALVSMGLLGLALAYLLASRAFDTGSLWQYTGAVLLILLSIRLCIRAAKPRK